VAARTPISLSWRRFDIDLTGAARPHGFVSAIGRRAALIGTETGSFEAWAWPLKLLHGFELACHRAARHRARHLSVAVALPDGGDAVDGYTARSVRVTVEP